MEIRIEDLLTTQALIAILYNLGLTTITGDASAALINALSGGTTTPSTGSSTYAQSTYSSASYS